ncbi:SMI1/KNR4 family protein [Bacillus cereus group sp. BfR-BA-01380]|uniref:SMI1/KNR4 family protein n=1 Tax=Bacillus cereus group sp. BfR-BA-01380 TaxID=2920324 RepID=UPI001F58FECE|nr:SMI1/KNR4 family protein [Bacillus cereus group sp. BfR-BA-01380]
MMDINFEYSFKVINEQDMKDFEMKCNVLLPDDYKNFLLLNNGGKTDRRRFTICNNKGATITSSIMLFFPLSQETENNLEEMYSLYNRGNIVPNNFLPIGIDPADSLICLAIEGKDAGYVYFCDLDYFEEDNELREEYIILMAKSFEDFVNNLFFPPAS